MFEYSGTAQAQSEVPRFCDYQVARLYEDVIELSPYALEPVPQELQRYIVLDESKPWNYYWTKWCEACDSRRTFEEGMNLLDDAGPWMGRRTLDSAYLTPSTNIVFWSDQDIGHIQWDNRDKVLQDGQAWSSHPVASIIWLRDGAGQFPVAQFSGEADSCAEGWASFTAESRREVVFAQLTPEEWNAGASGIACAAQRLHSKLHRGDLRPVQFLRVEQAAAARGASFKEFRERIGRAKLVYTALSDGGEAVFEREESLSEFQANGGVVTVVAA